MELLLNDPLPPAQQWPWWVGVLWPHDAQRFLHLLRQLWDERTTKQSREGAARPRAGPAAAQFLGPKTGDFGAGTPRDRFVSCTGVHAEKGAGQ